MPTTSRPSSSAAHGSLEDSGVGDRDGEGTDGEEDERHTHEEINTSQVPDAPQRSQQQQRYSFKVRKQREYSKDDIFIPDAYQNKKPARTQSSRRRLARSLSRFGFKGV